MNFEMGAELAADSGAADVPSAGEGMAVARLEPTTRARAGERMTLGLRPDSIHLFDARTGRNLALADSGDGPAPAPAAAPAEGDQASAGSSSDEPTTRLS